MGNSRASHMYKMEKKEKNSADIRARDISDTRRGEKEEDRKGTARGLSACTNNLSLNTLTRRGPCRENEQRLLLLLLLPLVHYQNIRDPLALLLPGSWSCCCKPRSRARHYVV